MRVDELDERFVDSGGLKEVLEVELDASGLAAGVFDGWVEGPVGKGLEAWGGGDLPHGRADGGEWAGVGGVARVEGRENFVFLADERVEGVAEGYIDCVGVWEGELVTDRSLRFAVGVEWGHGS